MVKQLNKELYLKKVKLTNLGKKITLSLFLSLLLLFVIETLVRAYLIGPYDINNWGFNLGGYGDLLPDKNFISSENPNLPYRVITNSFGLRNANETKLNKEEGMIRILTVGDSFTFGPYVNNQDTYPAKLEEHLKKLNLKVEVLNAGIMGYTLRDEIEYLEEKGLALKPDIVIVGIYQNDINDYSEGKLSIFSREVNKEKAKKWSWIYTFAKQSSFANYLEKIIMRRVVDKAMREVLDNNSKQTESDQNDRLTIYYSDLDKLINILEVNKIKPVFIFFPALTQINQSVSYFPQDKIIERLKGSYMLIDLLPIFKKESNPEAFYLMPFNSHLSSYGNDVVARTITELIQEKFITK